MLIEMKVTGLTIDPFTSMPIIILKDVEEKNVLPIWIGLIEASAIATELEKIQLSRPMTHDLLRNILRSVGVEVNRVAVTDLADNTFYARIYLREDGKEIELDARPSDAIALALRAKAPIFVEKTVVDKSRKIDLSKESDAELKKQKWAEILESLSPEDFGKYKM
ncbi:MAG: bifunctional nuclease family protein [Deltaproteobacteria bacterium]|nr:bifunctional nuclease family protein [Deltaproteobacteria bacterium]